MANQRLNIDVVARDKTKQALGGVQKSLARLKNSVFSLQSAFVGLGVGLVARNLINTGKNLENLRTRLKFLLKDANEGAKAFENMTKFASKVPFSLEQIQQGAGILATVTDNAKDLQQMLEITGNVAATTGLDFGTAAEQIQRSFSAGIGAADLFREKGVRNMLGFQAGATVSIEETRKAFQRVFGAGGQFGKATDELANTFEGTLSMIGDKIFNFKKVLLEAGFFDELKKQFGDLDTFLENNARDLDRIAVAVGKNLAQGMRSVVQIGKDLIPTLKQVGSILKSIIDGFMSLPPFVRTGGIIGAFLFGRKGLAALAGVSFLVDKINTMIKGIKTSMGIFDMQNLDDVDLRISQIKREIDELSDRRIFLEVEGGIVDDKRIDILLKELKTLEEQRRILKATVNLRNGNLPNLRDEFKIVKGITKEKEKVVELTNREKGLIKNSKQELEGFRDILRQMVGQSLRDLESKFANIKQIIAKGIVDGVKKISQSIAESIVLGKNLLETFKALAQQVLVNILAHLIEEIALLGIKKILKRDEVDANNTIESSLRRQIGYQSTLVAMNRLGFDTGMNVGGTSGKGQFGSTIGGAIGTSVGGPVGGAVGSFLGSFLPFAKGGAVSKGRPILVGENGPELYVPNQTGQITQSARGTGNGGTTVNFNINTVDASGFEELLFKSRGAISTLINQAVNEQGRGSLV